jgi:hypothetical protein
MLISWPSSKVKGVSNVGGPYRPPIPIDRMSTAAFLTRDQAGRVGPREIAWLTGIVSPCLCKTVGRCLHSGWIEVDEHLLPRLQVNRLLNLLFGCT